MNAYFRKALTISRVYLVENIDYENLKDFLLEYGILSGSILETIDSLPNRRQKVREMLDCLPRRADVVFPTFLVSLSRSNQHHISMKLYESTITLIDSNDFQLKNSLENNFKKILSTLPENNHVTYNTTLTKFISVKKHNEPTENSLPTTFDQIQESKTAMEFEDLDTFGSEPLSKDLTFSSFKYSDKFDSFSLKSQQMGCSVASSSSSLHQFHDNSLVYQMDSVPRGLFCIIIAKEESLLTKDAFPVQRKEKDPTSMGNNPYSYKSTVELQTLFWDFGFHSCVIELENSTLHSDKLNNIVFDFSRVSFHKVDCCAIALLGFSATDLHLLKIFSSFKEKHCPSLARKPKLFLIQIPNSEITPSNLLSGIEIPEDSLVAIGEEDKTSTQPGLVSSVVQVCRQMEHPSYSVQDIFSKVQDNNWKLKMAIEKSLTKSWIVNSQCKLAQGEPI